jgi:hypothetical protein
LVKTFERIRHVDTEIDELGVINAGKLLDIRAALLREVKMLKTPESISTVAAVLERFSKFAIARDPELGKRIMHMMLDFIEQSAKETA